MLHGLDLFTGIGGLSIALAPWVRPLAYCEIDRYAQGVLFSRMHDGSLPIAPIWDDVKSLSAQYLPAIDIIYGGFPCQDISVAGHGKGLEGERSGLFFEILRLVDECNPAFVFLENVSAIRTRGAERVVKELSSRGYDCRWECFTAQEVGAPHRRQRWFLLAANSNRLDLRNEPGWGEWTYGTGSTKPGDDGKTQSVANPSRLGRSEGRSESEVREGRGNDAPSGGPQISDPNSTGLEVGQSRESGQQPTSLGSDWWKSEPDVRRVVTRLPHRVDRIKCLGNSVVPAQAREAFKRLMGL